MRRLAEAGRVAEEWTRAEFDLLGPSWDALVERAGPDQPFLRHAFLRAWLDNFAPRKRLRLFVAREGPSLVAALPLLEERALHYHIPVRQLASASNAHSGRFDLVGGEGRPDAVQAIWARLRQVPGIDLVLLRDVPPHGRARALLPLAEAEGWRPVLWESMRSPFLPLREGWDAVQARLSKHFRANLRRRRNNLSRRGRIEHQRVQGGSDLERHLEEAFALEASGWKGREGTAVAQDEGRLGFYCELAREAARRGELELHLLRLDGRLVAFQLVLACRGTLYALKSSYDEAHADCSPGQLTIFEVVRDACARGLVELDFMGEANAWKREWTERERPHHWVYLFGSSPRARLLASLKGRLAPAVKEVLRWKR